jgi:molybdopterin-containing oxidoreductase family membrane subunit
MNGEVPISATFTDPLKLRQALEGLRGAGITDYEVFSPMSLVAMEPLMAKRGSVVRYWSLIGGFTGAVLGFAVCVVSAGLYKLIVGGKQPGALVPYVIVGFEFTVLTSAIVTVIALLVSARMVPKRPPDEYNPQYSVASFAVRLSCPRERLEEISGMFAQAGATEVNANP